MRLRPERKWRLAPDKFTAVLLAALAISHPCAAHAQATEEANGEWEVSVTAYAWLSGMSGDIGAIEGVQPVKVDMSFGDIFDHLKFAGMGMIQARHDRFVMAGDFEFVSLGASKDLKIRDVDLIEGELDTSVLTASALAGYRVSTGAPVVDLMGGARLNSVSTDIELSGPLRSVEGDLTETWVDPIIGTHVAIPMSSKTALALYGDVGGFGIGSDLTWQVLAAIQYEFNERWRASAGWRHYSVDYDKGAFLYDVSLSGPIIGIRYAF